MKHQRLRFGETLLATGVRLHYAEQGEPGGPPMILLHGLTDSWFSYSRVLPGLPDSYHIFALDLRGHGDSDRPAHGYMMSDFAADVISFMDTMELPSATLVGHSMGSLIAQQVALAAPRRVARMALLAAATNLHTPDLFEFLQAVEALEDPVPAGFAREFQVSTIYRPIPDDFLNQAVAESEKLPAHVWRGATAGCLAADYTADLGRIQVPVLLLRGDKDTVFPRAGQDALVAGLASAVLCVYPETGHALHWERPEQVVQDLNDFMTSSLSHTSSQSEPGYSDK